MNIFDIACVIAYAFVYDHNLGHTGKKEFVLPDR